MKTVLSAFNARFSHSSLAVRYIKAYNPDKDIYIAEFSINDSIHYAFSKLLGLKADIYCFSVYIWNIEITAKVAQMIKKALPECTIIFGGPECSYNPLEVLQKYDFLDYIILGEGEVTTGKVIESLEKGIKPSFDGVAHREYIGKLSKCVDLNTINFPYDENSFKELKNKIIYFETSRGCPFNCAYCLSSIEREIRYFPDKYVKSGFDAFFKNEVPLVKLIDRTFNANPSRASKIIKYIIDNSKNTKVHFEIDPSILTDELIKLLSSAPKDMFQLEMGIQSANIKTLKAVNRYANTDVIAKNIRKLKSAGNMHIHLDLIAGLPYEDYISFEKSFNFVFSLNPNMLQLGFLKVLHGTPIEKQSGIVYADFPPYEVISTKWISADEICRLKLIDKAVDEINNSGAFKKTVRKITSDNPFKAFEKIAEIFSSDRKLSRFDIYSSLYKIYGEYIFNELISDFIMFNKDRPMPDFARIEYKPNFRKNCLKLLYDGKFKNKFKSTGNLNSIRFEPVKDKIYMMDYDNLILSDITEYYKKITEN